THKSLATPKPRKPRFLLRWSPTGRLFDHDGKLVAPSNSEGHVDCSNGDNAYTSNAMEPKVKWFPNSTSLLGRLSRFVYGASTQLWHQRFPSCEQGKSKRASHPPKPVPNSRQRLYLIHMDLCGPMRIASINGKRYILVIVDDYSRYTWVHFLRSKDEAPAVIITFLKRITVLLQSPVIIIRTDNGTEFKNQVLKVYFDYVGISHQMSFVRTPQQNRVVERQNRTLVEAARTMLIFSRAPLFLWAEAIATACFTQNHSIIHRRFNKTPYELINGRKPDNSFLHVFGALCYPKNDREVIGKLGAKGDIGFFIGYSADSCAYRIYNRRTKKIMETMNVSFDELSAMAFEQRRSIVEMCRRRGLIRSHIKNKFATKEFFLEKIKEVLEHCNIIVPELTVAKTNEIIKKEMTLLVKLAVDKDREISLVDISGMVSKEFAAHGPKMIEELFHQHM
nr:retrovirus-related Pol polyprotein from transposon TNT 1-94 [Tanacetum cinerariifolium]